MTGFQIFVFFKNQKVVNLNFKKNHIMQQAPKSIARTGEVLCIR